MIARAFCRGLLAAVLAIGVVRPAAGIGTAFTFQGQLRQGAGPANGPCDFQFGLFDAPNAGTQIGAPVNTTLAVANGLFTTGLDFGPNAFNGADRFLQIGVRCPAGSGTFTTLNPRQSITPAPYAIFAPVVVRGEQGNVVASMERLNDGAGLVQTRGPNGNLNVQLTSLVGAPDLGFVGVYDQDGHERVSLQIIPGTGDGFVGTRGPNGNLNVTLSSLANFPNNGFVGVDDAQGNTQAGIFVNEAGEGIVFGDMKNFAVDHPTRADAKIIYASLEGPEAAIYHRGAVRLVHGRATIELPEHFTALADAETITVQLTPGSLNSKGLAFTSIHDGRIEIGELQRGTGSYDVHFVVHAVRKGYEDFKPVVSKEEFTARFGHMERSPSVTPSDHALRLSAVP